MAKRKLIQGQAVLVGTNHEITIPRRISKALGLRKGDQMLLRLVGNRIELVPASLVPKDQLWYWTPEWQQMEREADEDIARGNIKGFDSVKELLKELKS